MQYAVLAGLLAALSMTLGTEGHAQEPLGSVEQTATEVTSTTIGDIEEQARRWRITTEEYRRFEEAMDGPRGRFSAPNITPIEVLGIEAETVEERRRFAELWVDTIRRDTTKVLAFSRTVSETWRRLHGDEPLLDRTYINLHRLKNGERPLPSAGPLPPLAGQSQVEASDKLLVFTQVGCDSCSADVLRLVGQLENGAFAGLDIYLLDVADGDVAGIQSWAASLAISPELVQSGRLTLNFDGGAYQSLAESMQFTPAKFPVVMRRNGNDYGLVSLN